VRFCTGGLMMIQMDMLDMVEALVSLLLLFEDTPSVFFFFGYMISLAGQELEEHRNTVFHVTLKA
jgi:hypothetical protein